MILYKDVSMEEKIFYLTNGCHRGKKRSFQTCKSVKFPCIYQSSKNNEDSVLLVLFSKNIHLDLECCSQLILMCTLPKGLQIMNLSFSEAV